MKTNLPYFIVLIIFIPVITVSQHHSVDVNINLPEYFKHGDSYYGVGYQGIKALMYDLKKADVDAYEKLLPEYLKIEEKRKKAFMVGAGGAVLGTALSLIGFGTVIKSVDEYSATNSSPMKSIFTGGGLIIIGSSIFTTGLSASALIHPRKSDYFNVVNEYNRLNKGKKIEWKVGLSPFANNGLGLSFIMTL